MSITCWGTRGKTPHLIIPDAGISVDQHSAEGLSEVTREGCIQDWINCGIGIAKPEGYKVSFNHVFLFFSLKIFRRILPSVKNQGGTQVPTEQVSNA